MKISLYNKRGTDPDGLNIGWRHLRRPPDRLNRYDIRNRSSSNFTKSNLSTHLIPFDFIMNNTSDPCVVRLTKDTYRISRLMIESDST
ncbi:hypothetical protein HanXRQr2_Chr06g0244681 [Helianthus annuus]|uniref:Uncharacterized protein n=1 Tax=Helianthus annuus TaxID=4232 RepID=A0A9K3IRT8_HELAN|nr:hypothetical protein HanXRQr2_Chr06g0244681 [Helianthus annuus]